MNDLLITFDKAKFFCNIDLNMGYYQIKLDEASKKYTAFIIDFEQYQFNRLCFGLKNAPMVFSKGHEFNARTFRLRKSLSRRHNNNFNRRSYTF